MITTTITGHLGKDAQLSHTHNGTAVCNFSVASTRKRGDKENTTWMSCAIYGRRAEGVAKYLTKGTKVAVSGEQWTNEGQDGKTWINLDVTELDFMSRRDDQGGGQVDGFTEPDWMG